MVKHTRMCSTKFWTTFLLLLSFSQHQNALRKDCSRPLGMRSGMIKDSQLKASSSDWRWGPSHGRLYANHAWCSDDEKPGKDYFEIDLQRVRHVSAIATQGLTYAVIRKYFVKTYVVKYSYDGSMWYSYKENVSGEYKEKVFTGNTNSDDVVKNEFNEEFVTRFLRIYPLTFNKDMCLRVEVYGCDYRKGDCAKFIETSSGDIITPNYPELYPVGVECTWIIKGSPRQRIALFSKYFDVGDKAGSCSDSLKVRDGLNDWSTLLGTYCGGQHLTLVKSTENLLRIQFHSSQNSNPRKGFQLQFMEFTPGIDEVFYATACEGANLQLNCSKFTGMAVSVIHTFFGAYPFAQDCTKLYSNTSCQASNVTKIVQYHCQDYKQCDFPVQRSSFSPSSCPDALAQHLEVFYQCTSTNIKTAPPTSMSTTAAPAQPVLRKTPTHAPPTPNTNKSTSSPAPFSTTNPPIISTSTIASQREGTTEGTVPPPTTPEGSQGSAIEATVEARTAGGMTTGSLVAVVVVVVLLILGVLVAVILYVVCKRRRKDNHSPPVRYSRPSLTQENHKKRCNTDPDERMYDSINIIYESGDRETPNHLRAEEHIYDSATPGMTENPLYVRSTPMDDGYEIVRPPKRPAVMAPHMYEKPMEPQREHSKSIFNPNYDKTLTVKTLPEDV